MRWPGGRGQFTCVGTFGSETVSLEFLAPDGSTWLPVQDLGGNDIDLNSDGTALFELAPCMIRAAVSTGGGTPTGLYAVAARVPQ